MSFVTDYSETILDTLKQAEFSLVNEGFGRNVKATTSYPQYIIYLTDEYVHTPEGWFKTAVSKACPYLVVEAVHPIQYRRQGNIVTETWVFVKVDETLLPKLDKK